MCYKRALSKEYPQISATAFTFRRNITKDAMNLLLMTDIKFFTFYKKNHLNLKNRIK
jgi:hypothetical protein